MKNYTTERIFINLVSSNVMAIYFQWRAVIYLRRKITVVIELVAEVSWKKSILVILLRYQKRPNKKFPCSYSKKHINGHFFEKISTSTGHHCYCYFLLQRKYYLSLCATHQNKERISNIRHWFYWDLTVCSRDRTAFIIMQNIKQLISSS